MKHAVISMLKVDFRRMLKSRTFYILLACSLLIPIVMTVMLTMMDGQEQINQQTGEVTIMEGPESAWESIGTLPSDSAAQMPGAGADGGMDVMAMCNINMMYMLVCVFVCVFISEDFRSGYAKNIFTVRAKKANYVVSKTVVGFIAGALMLILYFIGAMLSGVMCGLSFSGDMSALSIAMCLLSKILLMLVFVSIYTVIAIAAKRKTWLSICGSLGGGMLLFMIVGMITPLTATPLHAALCAAGGLLFAVGLGLVGKTVLNKTSLV